MRISAAIHSGRRGLLIALAGLAVAVCAAQPAVSDSLAGSAGTDTSIPATDSKVTVSGRGPFADLKVTVNQTQNLVNQAVSITWTGGQPTTPSSGSFKGNFLQIMQCWGDDNGAVPLNPGPPPEQCVFGATESVPGGSGAALFTSGQFTTERLMSRQAWPNFDPTLGALDAKTGNVWRPFRAVKGEVIGVPYNPAFDVNLGVGNYWLNPYFNIVTTNEITAGRTAANGKGAELFQVNTGQESSGLGCGMRVEPVAGGQPKIPKCWIVVVPRGTASTEDGGTGFEQQADSIGVLTSPVSVEAWKNRIAIPLEFNPLDSPCQLSADQRRIVGTELAAAAVSSWQPALCTQPGRPPYAYGTVNDASARLQLVSNAPGAPGMAVVSRPFDPGTISPSNPATYAPVSLSATVVGFNVERIARDPVGNPAENLLSGVRVATINLTPRLMAKLLTQSYTLQVLIGGGNPNYAWMKGNPIDMGVDPDFLQFNPEFAQLEVGNERTFGGFVMPNGSSDMAAQVWEYVLADPEAKAWLDGAPDPWGMKVNAVYATKASANPSGAAFADPVPTSFPKSDSYCFQAPPQGNNPDTQQPLVPPPLCGTDWLPYTTSLHDAARFTRAADDRARIANNPLAITPDQVWKTDLPQYSPSRSILSITDSASAAQYGIQTARLSRAADNGPNRKFIAPDAAGLIAGLSSMKAKGQPAVLEPDPTAPAPSAYPLTALTYAAIMPLSVDAKGRDDYAAFVDYAAGPGQVPGLQLGQLPRGYAPLPAPLRAQATAAAKTIRELKPTEVPASAPPTAFGHRTPAPRATPAGTTAPVSGYPSPTQPAAVSAPTTPAPAPTRLATAAAPKSLLTPALAVAHSRFVLALAAVALLSALGALEITKRPRSSVLNEVAPPRPQDEAPT